MLSLLSSHIALVSESEQITFDDVGAVAAAVSKQVARDFGPAWGISATVQAFASLETIPSDYIQVILVDNDNMPGSAGYHTDSDGQPLAVVEVAGQWPLTVSHEVCELLANPFGNRIVNAEILPQAHLVEGIIPEGLHRVDYLVETCDPVESAECGYKINGIPVSDFVLPNFYSSAETPHPADFMGLLAPREIIGGGYISFRDPASGIWYQVFCDDGKFTAAVVSLQDRSSLLESMDRSARRERGVIPWRPLMRYGYPAHGGNERAIKTRAFLMSVPA